MTIRLRHFNLTLKPDPDHVQSWSRLRVITYKDKTYLISWSSQSLWASLAKNRLRLVFVSLVRLIFSSSSIGLFLLRLVSTSSPRLMTKLRRNSQKLDIILLHRLFVRKNGNRKIPELDFHNKMRFDNEVFMLEILETYSI